MAVTDAGCADAPVIQSDLTARTLGTLVRAELGAGILGLRLFIGCVAVASVMLGAVWMLGNGLTTALEENGLRILGGDVALTVPNSPLDPAVVADLRAAGSLSRSVELRTSARAGDVRATVELKAVDDAYPLYGRPRLDPAGSIADALATRENGLPGAVAESALLSRFGVGVGDRIRLGDLEFEIRAALVTEPDRLSSGRFLVGPRVIIGMGHLEETGLVEFGSLAEYRYRLRAPDGTDPAALIDTVRILTPERGWELETPRDAGDRVLRTVRRTTSFLGIAGIAALAIGLAGCWAAAAVWVGRRSRTIALYRLSGATPGLIAALHGIIMAAAGTLGLLLGLAIAAATAVQLMQTVTTQLHLDWRAAGLIQPALEVAVALVLGIAGAGVTALAAAARISPGAAMRSGEATLSPTRTHVGLGLALVGIGMAVAVVSLPIPGLAALAAVGLAAAAALLGLGGWSLARLAAMRHANSFVGTVARQGLAIPGAAATKALAIGIGIAGITAVVAAQSSLEAALRAELPAKAPALVLIDVQPDQVEPIRRYVADEPDLGGLQATPFMRSIILAVNGVPAEDALVRDDKRWVIEGDRSFSWTAEPIPGDLLGGEWWSPDHTGDPLVSAEEDAAQAFDLKPGDRLTYSVLGRTFTSEVVNIRKEYHRTFRPEFLLVASPQPFRNAPHSWIVTLQSEADPAVDAMIRHLGDTAANVTSIDVRRIVTQVTEVVDGAALGSLAIAAMLLIAGALALAAVVAADVDARRREAVAFTLVGASRREIALARLAESVGIGLLAAVLGGGAGLIGGYWLVEEALHVAWTPGVLPFLLPLILGVIAALAAGTAGGIGALPRGRGEVARILAN